jgi:homoaconitase/3-isopropylmalate dehydratase large subunit
VEDAFVHVEVGTATEVQPEVAAPLQPDLVRSVRRKFTAVSRPMSPMPWNRSTEAPGSRIAWPEAAEAALADARMISSGTNGRRRRGGISMSTQSPAAV